MPFVYEEGEPIDVGTHGETSYVYSDGEPVPNTGQSAIVFEDGVGLGGADKALVWRNGDDGNNFTDASGLANQITSVTSITTVEILTRNTKTLDEALSADTYGLVALTAETSNSRLTSSEKSALSDWWSNDAIQGALVLGENGDGSGSGRVATTNDYIEGMVGTRPYYDDSLVSENFDRTGGGTTYACFSDPYPNMPPFDGVSEIVGVSSEAVTSQPPTSEKVFWWHDPSNGPRIWADGSYTRFGDAHYTNCSGNTLYVDQTIEWLDRQI